MFNTVLSAAVFGVEGRLVSVEADVGDGLPSFAMVSFSGASRCTPARARSTSTVAVRAWNTPTTAACRPVARRSPSRNSLPMEKAMKPSATSLTRSSPPTASAVGKPSPSMPARPKK